MKHKFNRIRQVAPMFSHGRAHCRHLANRIKPSICCGDAALCQITWPPTTTALRPFVHLLEIPDNAEKTRTTFFYCGRCFCIVELWSFLPLFFLFFELQLQSQRRASVDDRICYVCLSYWCYVITPVYCGGTSPFFFMGHKFSKFRSFVVSNGDLTQLTAQCTENLRLIK